jgi:conjugative transfer signal peptidase TraF
MNANRRRLATVILVAPIACVALILLAGVFGLRLNTTASVPMGLYRLTDKDHGSYVTFCPVGTDALLMNERGYRPRGIGCRDGFEPLVKPVAAKAGDVVNVGFYGISVNGNLLRNTAAKKQDTQHRLLPILARGNHPVMPGTIWVLSTYNANSYDSRYFGAVSVERIISYAKPIWTF